MTVTYLVLDHVFVVDSRGLQDRRAGRNGPDGSRYTVDPALLHQLDCTQRGLGDRDASASAFRRELGRSSIETGPQDDVKSSVGMEQAAAGVSLKRAILRPLAMSLQPTPQTRMPE